jgi:nucleotidyltransferase substrate binding protein (TIGR01987 family)
MDISEKIVNELNHIAKKYNEIQKIVLFGSRARGDNTPHSDYDIAVFTINKEFKNRSRFFDDIDEIDTLYKFDIVTIYDKVDNKLLNNILKDGIVLMSGDTKISNYIHAVGRLKEAISESGENPSPLNQDGTIQRFEFSVELAWKACREYLLNQGFSDLNSPKSVLKQAFEYELVSDGEAWIEILNDRNLTSHIYNEETATEIFNRIRTKHITYFLELIKKFDKNE